MASYAPLWQLDYTNRQTITLISPQTPSLQPRSLATLPASAWRPRCRGLYHRIEYGPCCCCCRYSCCFRTHDCWCCCYCFFCWISSCFLSERFPSWANRSGSRWQSWEEGQLKHHQQRASCGYRAPREQAERVLRRLPWPPGRGGGGKGTSLARPPPPIECWPPGMPVTSCLLLARDYLREDHRGRGGGGRRRVLDRCRWSSPRRRGKARPAVPQTRARTSRGFDFLRPYLVVNARTAVAS